jgi:hypothetical protein
VQWNGAGACLWSRFGVSGTSLYPEPLTPSVFCACCLSQEGSPAAVDISSEALGLEDWVMCETCYSERLQAKVGYRVPRFSQQSGLATFPAVNYSLLGCRIEKSVNCKDYSLPLL